MPTLNELIVSLEVAAPKLPPRQQAAAIDLASKARRFKRATGPQISYMVALVKQAAGENTRPARETASVGDMSGVIAIFDKAAAHLKAPAIVIARNAEQEDGSTQIEMIRLKLCGETSQYKGEVNVKTEDGLWLGRIDRKGEFEINRREREVSTSVIPLLSRFAADPVTGAKESARLTGRCVFCNTNIKDERSTRVGYGRICAKRYDLPY